MLIVVNRSWERGWLATLRTPNLASWAVVALALSIRFASLLVPFFRGLFRFGAVSPQDAALVAAAGLLCLSWFEVAKALRPSWLAGD